MRVLHCRKGDEISLFDGHGRTFTGLIDQIEPDGTIIGRIQPLTPTLSPVRLDLYQSLIKGAHWDWMIEKGTELGVSSFIPVLTRRAVVSHKSAKEFEGKKLRSQRLALASAKQCGRADLPAVRDPMTFEQALEDCRKNDGVTLVAWEGLKAGSGNLGAILRQALVGLAPGSHPTVHLFIGPEGGFDPEEIELARKLGALLFGLGPLILRAETAAIVSCALIQHELSR